MHLPLQFITALSASPLLHCANADSPGNWRTAGLLEGLKADNPHRARKLCPLFTIFQALDWIRYFPLEGINFPILDHLQGEHSFVFCLKHVPNQTQNARTVAQDNAIHSLIHCASKLLNVLRFLWTFYLFSTQTLSGEWLAPTVCDSLYKQTPFLLLLNFSSLLTLVLWSLVSTNTLMPFVARWLWSSPHAVFISVGWKS